MAIKMQIDELAPRVDDLAQRSASRWSGQWVQIIQQKYPRETNYDAATKYFADHPEQRGANIILQVII